MIVTSATRPEPGTPGTSDAATGEGWRWDARRMLAEVRDQLVAEPPGAYDGWLAARGGRVMRERDVLLRRLGALGPLVHTGSRSAVQAQLRRLVDDVARHRQRERDLHWDEVELEIGGSE
ncbi:hypothetical protein [Nocardioides euryhalodurans]|uniref:Uncharacterized protein n=1 Tax=Nocardioides euryhalodurans TaxID=2518370 RepID=A0A4P7GLQ5_9ACTN|nr:hypothetical protein [Nocardioides euryhalodurans]QBR92754.1 hypothetical protein EXE57_11055 [Nocardioides euryhalodurans]